MKGRQRATTGIYPTKESTKQTTKDQITDRNTTTHPRYAYGTFSTSPLEGADNAT